MMVQYKLKYNHIAVDFDGTLFEEDNFPIIGKEIFFAAEVLRKIIAHGGMVSIWTCRTNQDLHNAITKLKELDIPYTYINYDFPMAQQYEGFSRKLWADIYIDNKDIHCIMNGGIDWVKIHEAIFERVGE